MHVKENTALSSAGDVEIKEEIPDEPSISSTATSTISHAGSISSTSSVTSSVTDVSRIEGVSEFVSTAHRVTDSVSSTHSVTSTVSLTQSVTNCVSSVPSVLDSVDVSKRLLPTSVESDNSMQSVTESVTSTQSVTESVNSSQSVTESVSSTQSLTDCVSSSHSITDVVSLRQNAVGSHTVNGAAIADHVASLPVLDMPMDVINAIDSAVETDDSSQEDMVIDAKDIKQEVDSEVEDIKEEVDSEGEDTVDGNVLHRLCDIDLKLEPDSNSNSSCSISASFWNGESDASMRQRLFNSLSQSFPGSALSRVLHSVDTQPLDSEDEDLVPSAERLSSSCFGSIRLDKEDDDDLTPLSWLQDSDLLKNINADLDSINEEQKENAEGQKNSDSGGGNFVPQTHPCHVPYNPLKHVNSKPPYSFSCLIFMAVEAAPGKKLPVKDIYNWILTNFPYFQNAPTGWKNSVRHNLSLNKCFKKVEKDKGANIGKGSLWCIDPEYRPNLLQALRKTPYHPYQQLQMMSSMVPPQQVHHVQGFPGTFRAMPLTQRPVPNTVSPHLFPFLSRRLAQTNIDREMQDVANVLVSLSSRNSSGLSSDGSDASGPTSPRSRMMKRKICGPPKRQGPFIITPYPSTEHNYASPRILDEDGASGTSSIDNEYDFGDNDDISEPSDYPSDWDDTSGDEVDGDLPQQVPRKRLKFEMSEEKQRKYEDNDEAAKLLMRFAGWADSSDEEDKGSPVKSANACSKPRSVSSKSRRSPSAPPSTKKRSSSAACKSSSSLSSSQSSTSSSRSLTTKSARPVSRSALTSRLSPKGSANSSAASPSVSARSSGSASSKTSAASKTSSMSVSKSSGGTSPQASSSSKKSESGTPPSAKPVSTPESVAKSSGSASSSAIKSSIIMTRRGKAAAEAEKMAALAAATEATTAAIHKMRTRGKKLSFS